MTKCTVIEMTERSRRGRKGVFRNLALKSRGISRSVGSLISRLFNSKRNKFRQILQFPEQQNSEITTEQQKGNNS